MEQNIEENSENANKEPIEVKLYFDMHQKKDGTWSHPQAQENYVSSHNIYVKFILILVLLLLRLHYYF